MVQGHDPPPHPYNKDPVHNSVYGMYGLAIVSLLLGVPGTLFTGIWGLSIVASTNLFLSGYPALSWYRHWRHADQSSGIHFLLLADPPRSVIHLSTVVSILLLVLTGFIAWFSYFMMLWPLDDGLAVGLSDRGWLWQAFRRWRLHTGFDLLFLVMVLPSVVFAQPVFCRPHLGLRQRVWGHSAIARTALLILTLVFIQQGALIVGVIRFMLERPWF